MDVNIRLEQEQDYSKVINLVRDCFWNLYVPGCNEHLIVHNMRKKNDFIKDLAYVLEVNNEIIGYIMHTKSKIIQENGASITTLTIGPVCIHPDHQNLGYGLKLVEYTKIKAKELGYKSIIIYGYPEYYKKLGFKGASSYGISRGDGLFAPALLALELEKGSLNGAKGSFHESNGYYVSDEELEEFENNFPFKEKLVLPSQHQFELMASLIEDVE